MRRVVAFLPLVLIWVGSPHVCLLRRGPRRREAECLLQVLSDAHGAEDVEEDERAICVILPEQIPMQSENTDPGLVSRVDWSYKSRDAFLKKLTFIQ